MAGGKREQDLIRTIRDISPGASGENLLTPAAPLVLLEYKASSATTEVGAWGADTAVLTAMGPFRAQVNGRGKGEVGICPGPVLLSQDGTTTTRAF